jgi:hypothetical protein
MGDISEVVEMGSIIFPEVYFSEKCDDYRGGGRNGSANSVAGILASDATVFAW